MLANANRRSKYLTQTLAQKYIEAQEDPELMSLRQDLSLIEVRLSQLLERIQKAERPEAWDELRNLFRDYKLEASEGSPAKMMALEMQINDVFDAREKDYIAWKEVMDLIEQRRKVGESEQKRLIAMKQMIAAEDAMKLIGQLLAAVKKHIGKTPEEAYRAIGYEFAIIAGEADRGELQTGVGKNFSPDRPGGMDNPEFLDS